MYHASGIMHEPMGASKVHYLHIENYRTLPKVRVEPSPFTKVYPDLRGSKYEKKLRYYSELSEVSSLPSLLISSRISYSPCIACSNPPSGAGPCCFRLSLRTHPGRFLLVRAPPSQLRAA